MTSYALSIMLVGLGAALAPAAMAQKADPAAIQKAQQPRLELQAKQTELAQQQRVEMPAAPAPAPTLELTIDESDSPGATK